MTPFHSDESLKDLRKKWNGTYVKLHQDGKWCIVNIRDFQESNLFLRGHTQNGIIIVEHANYHWDVSLPPRGWFNYGSTAVFARRYSKRQWKQGLCEETVGFERPTWRLRTTIGPLHAAGLPITLGSVEAVWEPSAFSLYSASKSILQRHRVEVALSSEIMVMANPFGQTRNLLVFYDKNPACEYDSDTDTFWLETPLFYQEIIDFVRRNNLPCSVKFI